jgi:hypothetical protein
MKMDEHRIRTTHTSSMDDRSSSDGIPTEILAKILGFIAPEMPDVEERPMEPSSRYLTSRSTLFHLCLASSKFDALARPLLFRTIVIWEPDSLLLLWRSLRCRPNLGRLARRSVVQNIVNAVKEKLESSRLSDEQDLYRTLIDCHDRHESSELDISQHMVFDILCRTPHLRTFSLQVPRTAEDVHYTYLIRMMAGSCGLDAISAQPVTLSRDQPLGISRSLTTLQLCLDPCLPAALRSRSDEDEDMGFDHQDYWPLFGLSSLVRLYCWGDDASFPFALLLEEDGPTGLGAPPEGYLGSIKEICFDASSSGPKSLYSLCQNAPRLQSLRVNQRRHSQDFWDWPYTNSLDRGLLIRASTLRHLYLRFYDSQAYQRLTCLPQICHLETLQIQLQTLFGNRSAISSVDIGSILPRSLLELTLDDHWKEDVIETENRIKMYSGLIEPEEFESGWNYLPGQTAAGFWYCYGRYIVKILERLCEVSSERLPHLRRVHYVSDHWSTRQQGYGQSKPFDKIQGMFSERGIEFYAGETMPMHR